MSRRLICRPRTPLAPQPEEFGLNTSDIATLEDLQRRSWDNSAGTAWLEQLLPEKDRLDCDVLETCFRYAVFLTLGWFFFLVGILFSPVIQWCALRRFQGHPKWAAFHKYTMALHEFERVKRDFWFNLSGSDFEHELAALYRQSGYSATVTRCSGDEGIDILLVGREGRGIVQCKQQAKPVGPAVARELYGSLIASRASFAILACTSGFTQGVFAFVKDKPIELIDVDDIVRMKDAANTRTNC